MDRNRLEELKQWRHDLMVDAEEEGTKQLDSSINALDWAIEQIEAAQPQPEAVERAVKSLQWLRAFGDLKKEQDVDLAIAALRAYKPSDGCEWCNTESAVYMQKQRGHKFCGYCGRKIGGE